MSLYGYDVGAMVGPFDVQPIGSTEQVGPFGVNYPQAQPGDFSAITVPSASRSAFTPEVLLGVAAVLAVGVAALVGLRVFRVI